MDEEITMIVIRAIITNAEWREYNKFHLEKQRETYNGVPAKHLLGPMEQYELAISGSLKLIIQKHCALVGSLISELLVTIYENNSVKYTSTVAENFQIFEEMVATHISTITEAETKLQRSMSDYLAEK